MFFESRSDRVSRLELSRDAIRDLRAVVSAVEVEVDCLRVSSSDSIDALAVSATVSDVFP